MHDRFEAWLSETFLQSLLHVFLPIYEPLIMSSYPPNSGDNFGTRTYSRGATTGGAYPETTTFDVGTTSPTSNPPWTAPTTAYPPRTNASNVNDTSDDAAIAALLQAEEDYYTSTAASRAKAPPVPVAAGVPSAVTAPYYLSANSTRAAPAAIELTPMSSTPSAASSGTTLNGSVSPYQGATVDLDADSWKAAYDAAGIPLQRPKVNVPLPNEPTKPWWRSGWFLCVAAILVCIAVLIPVLLITTGVIKVYPTPAKPPPVWIDWYNATGARAAPNCSLLATPSSQQPTFADFDTPMPDQPVASMQQVINMNNDYGLDETAPDNFPFLQKALTDCKGTNPWQGCRLTMRRGIYRFTSERPLFFDRLVNFTLDGNSSIFLFSRRSVFSRLTAFDSCRSVKIVNLQMDWDWSIWRLASLVQIDAVQATQPGSLGQQILRMRFLDHPMLDMSTINGLQDMHAVDPSTLTVGVRDTNRFGQYWSLDNHVLAMEQSWDKEKVTNNTVTVTLDKALTPPPDVGGLYLIRHFTYEGHALQFAKCSDFWIDNVKVWGAPGMALAVHPGSSDFRVTNFTVGILGNSTLENVTRIVNETVPGFFNVTLLPTSNSTLGLRNSTNVTVSHISLPALSRRISTTADGLNFIGTTGHIHVEDAEVGFQGDDCANANPPIVLGISRSSESDSGSRIVLRDWQSLRMGTIEEGNQLEFRNPDFSPTGVIRKVRGQPYWTQGAGWNVDIEGPKLPVLGDGWVGANGERWLGTDPTVIVFK